MLDNLRRSLGRAGGAGAARFALGSGGVSPWASFLLVAFAFSGGPLMGALAGLAPSRDDIARIHFYRQALADLGRALARPAWLLAQLLQLALMATDAIVRALYRQFVSKRHLLEWTTAAAAEAAATTDLRVLVRKHWRRAGRGGRALARRSWRAARPTRRGDAALPRLGDVAAVDVVGEPAAADARGARALAATTAPAARRRPRHLAPVRALRRRRGPHLPPDNLQVVPRDMVAHRTSPTNIGLYLLATACAQRFGWIGVDELIERIEATLATLATLPRHRGHFFNWYDTRSAEALTPQYVSTVDSGNLCTHLLALANACDEMRAAPPDARAATAGVVDAARLAREAIPAPAPGRQMRLPSAGVFSRRSTRVLAATEDPAAASLPHRERFASLGSDASALVRAAHEFAALVGEATTSDLDARGRRWSSRRSRATAATSRWAMPVRTWPRGGSRGSRTPR